MVLSGAAALPSGTLTKLFSFSASAQTRSGTCGDNINWTLDENGKLTISGTGGDYYWADSIFSDDNSIKSLVVENGITRLVNTMFYNCKELENVSVADSVENIGPSAFEGTKWLDEQRKKGSFVIINDILLEANNIHNEVTIPNSVRVIGKSAFFNTDIWKVYIPEGVEIIDWNAFTNCSQLTSINIPDSVHTIGSSAFMNCNLWSVQIGKGVKTIDSEAFYGNKNLSEITIPDNVETVEDTAFGNCTNLTSVNIGSGVKTLNPSSFSGCEKLDEINISKDNPYYASVNGFVFNKEMTELALTPNEKECYIPEGVKRIREDQFKDNDSIEYVYLPDTVTKIDKNGFSRCRNLKSVSLSSKLESIGVFGFSECKSLEDIIIPDSVTLMDQCAMSLCDNLKSVDLSCNPLCTNISHDLLSYNYSLEKVEIPQNIKCIEQSSFFNCHALENVTLYEGLKEIESNAFLNCKKLKSIKIPKSVTRIGDYAFGYSWDNEAIKYTDFTIYCYKDTEGERYARDNGFKYVILDECEHEYTVQAVPANCLKFGYDLHTCQKCGETFKDNFTDLLGHSYGNWEVCEEASCIKTGTQQKVCEHCGLTVSKQIDKADHIWGEWTVIEKPSAARLGLKERSCKVCGKIESEIMPKDESVKDIYRLAGKNRYETAANISSVSTPFSDNVVLACGMNYADALAGVPLANALGAPILLTNKDNLPQETLDEIKRIKAKNVFLLGGEGAVGAEVEKTLKNNHLAVERIAGATRFETATRIAEKMQTVSGKASSEVFFVYAFDFADALSASTAAAIKGSPIIYLNTKGELDNTTKRYLESVKGNVKTAYVIGGSGVISDDMMNKAAKALGLSKATRIAGANRFATCVAVNEKFADVLNGDMLCVATGMDFPDALAGGVYAALNKAPLFLINGKLKTPKLSDEQKTYLKTKAANSITAFGGVGVVPDNHIADIAKSSI